MNTTFENSTREFNNFLEAQQLSKAEVADILGVSKIYAYKLTDEKLQLSGNVVLITKIAALMGVEPTKFKEFPQNMRSNYSYSLSNELFMQVRNRTTNTNIAIIKDMPHDLRSTLLEVLIGSPVKPDVYFLDSVQRAGIYFSKEELTKLFHVALSETFKSIGVTACAENVRFIELATEVYTRSK